MGRPQLVPGAEPRHFRLHGRRDGHQDLFRIVLTLPRDLQQDRWLSPEEDASVEGQGVRPPVMHSVHPEARAQGGHRRRMDRLWVASFKFSTNHGRSTEDRSSRPERPEKQHFFCCWSKESGTRRRWVLALLWKEYLSSGVHIRRNILETWSTVRHWQCSREYRHSLCEHLLAHRRLERRRRKCQERVCSLGCLSLGCMLKVVEKLNEQELMDGRKGEQMKCHFVVHNIQPAGFTRADLSWLVGLHEPKRSFFSSHYNIVFFHVYASCVGSQQVEKENNLLL